jgi:glycosyltransferase involved in cell wall biosynthesis
VGAHFAESVEPLRQSCLIATSCHLTDSENAGSDRESGLRRLTVSNDKPGSPDDRRWDRRRQDDDPDADSAGELEHRPYRPDDAVAAAGFEAWRSSRLDGPVRLSIVIPAYNEKSRIVPTVGAIAAFMAGIESSWEIVIADDGSKDGTPDMVERLGLPNVRVLRADRNRGKGAAVRRGLQASRGEYILFTDADLSTPIEAIDDLLDALEVGADVAIGSRAADGASEGGKSGMRKLMSNGLRMVQTVVVPTGVKDTQCGFKMFRRDAAMRLTAVQRIDGFAFDLELLHAAHRMGMQVVERPVEWVDAPGSKVRPIRDTRRFFESMARIRLSWATQHHRKAHEEAKVERGLKVALVSAHPPAHTMMSEYGKHLVKAFAGRDEIDQLVLMHHDVEGKVEVPQGVTATSAWRFDSFATPVRIVRELRKSKPDVVVTNVQFRSFGRNRWTDLAGVASPLIGRLCGFPTITVLHDTIDIADRHDASLDSPRSERVKRKMAEWRTRLILSADRVVVFVPQLATSLQSTYGVRNVYLVPHGVFDTRVDSAFNGGRALQPTILEFGKFGTYKRVEPLIEAFRMLQADGFDARLVIAGADAPGAAGYLASVAAAQPDLDGIEFAGFVPDADVPGLFRSASIVVYSYASGGTSSPLHQAAGYGRAIVLPDVPELTSIVQQEGYTAETFEPGDTDDLARALRRLLNDDLRRSWMEQQNATAAHAQRLSRIAGWYVLHMIDLIESRPGSRLSAVRDRFSTAAVLPFRAPRERTALIADRSDAPSGEPSPSN